MKEELAALGPQIEKKARVLLPYTVETHNDRLNETIQMNSRKRKAS
jgi:hypothetical protein